MGQDALLFPSICGLVNIYVMCADGQLFFDFEHKVLIGFATEGHGLRFPSTCFCLY